MIYKTIISNVLTLLVVYITGGARSRSSIFKYKSLMSLLKSIKRVILPIICLNLFLSTEDGLKEIYKQNHNYLLFLTTDFCSSRKLYKLSGHSHMAIIKFDKNVDRIRHYTAKKDNIFRLRFYSPLGAEVVGDNALIWTLMALREAPLRTSLNQTVYFRFAFATTGKLLRDNVCWCW